jgi:hypothetical protein
LGKNHGKKRRRRNEQPLSHSKKTKNRKNRTAGIYAQTYIFICIYIKRKEKKILQETKD